MPKPTNPLLEALNRRLVEERTLCDATADMARAVLEPAFLAAAERLLADTPQLDRRILRALSWMDALAQPGVLDLVEAHLQAAEDLEHARQSLATLRLH